MAPLPTVSDLLALDVIRHGEPQVVAGGEGVRRKVRWVHVSELPDIADLLRGGEVVLTTGIGLPEGDKALRRYIEALEQVGASGLIVELGRRYSELPRPMITAAQQAGLPLITLGREIQFVQVTEAVHRLIVNAQFESLQLSEAVHRIFTDLSVEGATPQQIVTVAAERLAKPVILENLARQVVAHAGDRKQLGELLDGWERRSRRISTPAGSPRAHGDDEWLVSAVGARGEVWGRLLVPCAAGTSSTDLVILERAAASIALNRLFERDQETLERLSHRTLLGDILERRYDDAAEIEMRSRALGVSLAGRRQLAVVVRFPAEDGAVLEQQARSRDLTELVARAATDAGVMALVGPLREQVVVGALLSLDEPDHAAAVARFADRIHRAAKAVGESAVVGVGSPVATMADVRRSFREAGQVAEAASTLGGTKSYFELPDVRLRGLLHLMRDDARLQTFVEREVGPLLEYDEKHRTDLVTALSAYLDQGRNKSAAADALHLSRPALYQRLERIERLLRVDLANAESCLSLHVALLARDSMRATTAEWP